MTDSLTPLQRVVRWLPLVVIGTAILAYANSFSGVLIFDDHILITANPKIYRLWPPWEIITAPTRLIPELTLALNYAVGGLNVADYHAVNLLIHIGVALLLYGVMRRALLLPRFGNRFFGAAPWLAVSVATLWAVHPVQTETVTYIVQRIESLMALFYLLTLYCFLRGMTSPRPRAWFNGAVAACLVGMGTKEMIATLPAMVLLFDWVFGGPARAMWRARGKVHVALWMTLAVFGLLVLLTVGRHSGKGDLYYQVVTPWQYALTQCEVLLHYLRIALVPWPLCLDYMWTPVERWSEVVVPSLVVGAVVLVTLIGLARRQPWSFLAAFFLGVLAPTSSILPLPDPAFDHRMYLSLAALIAGIVVGGYTVLGMAGGMAPGPGRMRRIAGGGILLFTVAAAFVHLTRLRNEDYVSEERMWRDILRTRPNNYRAYVGLSKGLLTGGRFEEATRCCSNLLQRLPPFGGIEIREMTRAASESPEFRLQMIYYALAQNNLGTALAFLDRHEEAQACYREALRARPENSSARNNLGYEFYRQGMTNEAVRLWRETLQWDAAEPSAHCFLGLVFDERGQAKEAIHHFRQAVRTAAGMAYYEYRLAWLLATAQEEALRDTTEALRLAQQLHQSTQGKSARVWDLMGVAYAAAGDFDRAVLCAENALELAKAAVEDRIGHGVEVHGSAPARAADAVTDISARIRLYRQRQPFRETRSSPGP